LSPFGINEVNQELVGMFLLPGGKVDGPKFGEHCCISVCNCKGKTKQVRLVKLVIIERGVISLESSS